MAEQIFEKKSLRRIPNIVLLRIRFVAPSLTFKKKPRLPTGEKGRRGYSEAPCYRDGKTA